MKKHSFLFALAAIAALAVSCGGDDPVEVGDKAILGTWYLVGEDYHPVIATFNADGTYEWEYGGITGLKDNGTYTKSGNVITIKIDKYWEKNGDRVWHDDGSIEITGTWEKSTWAVEGPDVRTCTILMLQEPVLIWSVKGDYFFSAEDDMVMFMSRNASEMPEVGDKLTAKDIEGEYEYKDSDGVLRARLILNGNNFTGYSLIENRDFSNGVETITCYTLKETGTFSVNGSKITINYQKYYSGFKSEQDPTTYEWNYIFSKYDPATLESEEWLSENESDWSEEFLLFRDGSNLYYGLGAHAYAWKKK